MEEQEERRFIMFLSCWLDSRRSDIWDWSSDKACWVSVTDSQVITPSSNMRFDLWRSRSETRELISSSLMAHFKLSQIRTAPLTFETPERLEKEQICRSRSE